MQRPSCSSADLVSEGAPASTAPAVVLTILAVDGLRRGEPINRTRGIGPLRHTGRHPAGKVHGLVGIRSAKECYRNVLRYSPGGMPVAR